MTDAPEDISPPEKVVMVVSTLFTVSLFLFAVWQSLGATAAVPTANATGQQITAEGDVIYTIELRNPGDAGLVWVTVEVDCIDPPVVLTFQNVPADGSRTGSVVCPPETDDPEVAVEAWIPG